MIEKSFLISYFANFQDLNKLIDVKRVSIIDAIILNKSMLDSRGNAKDGLYGHYEERGGEEYIPPDGFDRFGYDKNGYNRDGYDAFGNKKISLK